MLPSAKEFQKLRAKFWNLKKRKISESWKNLGNFRIIEEKNLSKSQKKKNLRISEEEKYLGMRKISESRNNGNLGISELAELWNLANLEHNLGTWQH
jgi:hypothetical protein